MEHVGLKMIHYSTIKGFLKTIIHKFKLQKYCTNENITDESFALMKLQQESGFIKNIILDKDEDIWNKII